MTVHPERSRGTPPFIPSGVEGPLLALSLLLLGCGSLTPPRPDGGTGGGFFPIGGGQAVLNGEISAIAVESASEIWVVGTGLGLARFNGAQWRPSGLGPPLLTSFDALALESAHVYVGGHDAASRPGLPPSALKYPESAG